MNRKMLYLSLACAWTMVWIVGYGRSAAQTRNGEGAIKLVVRADGVQVKIEVTPIMRGCVYEPAVRAVSPRVEAEFGFAEIQVVSFPDQTPASRFSGTVMLYLASSFPPRTSIRLPPPKSIPLRSSLFSHA